MAIALALSGIAAPTGCPQNGQDSDPCEELRRFCALYGRPCGNSPSPGVMELPTIRGLLDRGVDIVPLLMDLVRQKDHTYVLKYHPFPGSRIPVEVFWGDATSMRVHCASTAMEILADTQDPRALKFLIERYRDRSENAGVRFFAVGRLIFFVQTPEVKHLIVEMLRTPEVFYSASDCDWVFAEASSLCEWIQGRQLHGDWREIADAFDYRLHEDHAKYLDGWEKLPPLERPLHEANTIGIVRALRALSTVKDGAGDGSKPGAVGPPPKGIGPIPVVTPNGAKKSGSPSTPALPVVAEEPAPSRTPAILAFLAGTVTLLWLGWRRRRGR